MNKFLKAAGIVFLGLIVLTAFGPLARLAIGIAGAYHCYKKFSQSHTSGERIGWALLGIWLAMIFLNVGSLISGALALGALYVIFKDKKPSEIINP